MKGKNRWTFSLLILLLACILLLIAMLSNQKLNSSLSQDDAVAHAQLFLLQSVPHANTYEQTPSRIHEQADTWEIYFPMKPPVNVRPSEILIEVKKSDGTARVVPLR